MYNVSWRACGCHGVGTRFVVREGTANTLMGLFNFLAALKPNPTARWVADPSLELQFDFNTHALCRVKVGDFAEKLSILGPAEDPAATKRGRLRYFTLGLEVDIDEDMVRGYRLVWNTDADMDYLPFRGACRQGAKHLEVSCDTLERELLDWFSIPYWRDQGERSIELFYEYPDIEWRFSLTPEGRLNTLSVSGEPLLAREKERQRLGVTKAWPPGR